MTIEEKRIRDKKMAADYDNLVETISPTNAYKALSKKYHLDWQVVMRNIKRVKEEQKAESMEE